MISQIDSIQKKRFQKSHARKATTNFGIYILSLISLVVLGFSSKQPQVDIGVAEFLRRDFENHAVVMAKIAKLNKKVVSSRWTDVESIDLTIKNVVVSSNPKALERVTCDLTSDADMIAPFQHLGADTSWDLETGEEIIGYIGYKKGKCELVHLSKIKNAMVDFPEYKKQKKIEIPVDKFIDKVKETFPRSK